MREVGASNTWRVAQKNMGRYSGPKRARLGLCLSCLVLVVMLIVAIGLPLMKQAIHFRANDREHWQSGIINPRKQIAWFNLEEGNP